MSHRTMVAASFVLLWVLGACSAPGTAPVVETLASSPVVTAALPSQDTPSPRTPMPAATVQPPVPTPTQADESEPAGAAGEPDIAAIALKATATALSVAPDAVRIVSIEAVQWPDSCLGVSITDQACAEVITPGYRIVVEAGGISYAVHTNEDGSAVRFAGPQEPPAAAISGDLGMVWGSSSEPCQSAVITQETLSFGPCGGPSKEVPLAAQELAGDLAYYTSIYASFEAQTPAGSLAFFGAGPAVATPAEQRMMAEWAQAAVRRSETGRDDAAWGLALTWHREGGFAGFCDDLAVYTSGYGLPSTCQTEPPATLGQRWLAAGETHQLFAWIDDLASFEYGQKDPATADAMTLQLAFNGAGTGVATDRDKQAMLDFAAWLTTYGAQATDVRYVDASTDLPVTGGPGTQFPPIGEVYAGQTVFVTGISPNQEWWRVICADGTAGNCWVTADPQKTQPVEPPGQPSAGSTPPPWDPAEIYAAVIRQVVTVDHTFGQPPDFPIVYLVRQTSGNLAIPGSAAGSETIFPDDQQRISALLADLPSKFVWVDRIDDAPRGEYERVAGDGAAVQVGAITPQEDGSLQVPGSIFIAPLAAGGQTYVLQFIDGRWTITGKAGPVWMS